MQIDSFAFGRMVVDGRRYGSDLRIFPDGRVAEDWWRRQGHGLVMEDIDDLVAAAPEVIVIGTGVHGRLRPDPALAGQLSERGIELTAAPNAEAVATFNRLSGRRRLAAGFHLTC